MQLRPAAEVVVGQLAPRPDEVVLDLGRGTGNAAMIAASRGARVIGVDPSPRLLEVARAVAAAAGIDAAFALGDAGSLPVPDGCVDAIVSVFGVIFAPDAEAAAAEMARTLRPGRVLCVAATGRPGQKPTSMRSLPVTLAGLRRASCWSRSAGGRMSEPISFDCSSTPTRIRMPCASPAATW